MTDQVREAIETHGDAVSMVIAEVLPQHSAILPSEMLAFCCLCRQRGVRHVTESGRKYGYSTEVLSWFPWSVTSIETQVEPEYDARLAGRENLELVNANGETYISHDDPPQPAGLLLDGPKGLVALDLAGQVQDRYAVVAIHDAHPGSELRRSVEGRAYLTDDPWLIDRYGHLDRETLSYRGYSRHDQLLSSASVLAIIR